jgi:hypothetical protein
MKLPFCKFALAASLLVATSLANATITVFNAFLDQNEGHSHRLARDWLRGGHVGFNWTYNARPSYFRWIARHNDGVAHPRPNTSAIHRNCWCRDHDTDRSRVFPLGVTFGTYDNTLAMLQASSYNPAFVTANGGTPATAEAALFSAMAAGESYLNIHTSLFTGGEIRGFLIAAVPEPETYAMMLAGLGLLGFVARRRKQIAG